MVDIVLLVVAIGGVVFLLWPRKTSNRTQDLMSFKEIYPNGLIELPDYKFRLVLEVEPVNISLRSVQEQASVWLALRAMVNSLNIPCTVLVQTRYLNLKDYLDYYRRSAAEYSPHISGYANRLCDWLIAESEGKHQRDRRLYIILKIDANSQGIESGIQTDNPIANTALKTLGSISQAKLPAKELRRLAEDELFEAASVVRSSLESIEVSSHILDRHGVLEMLYQTFNRDMAPYARLVEADRDGVFSLLCYSQTPHMVERSLVNGD